MSTKQEVREAIKIRDRLVDNYKSMFSLLFHNSITIENLPKELPKRYLLRNLLRRGSIAYDKISKLYLPYTIGEIDQYGLPLKYQVYGYKGFNAWRNIDEVVILRANDLSYALFPYFSLQAEKIANIDMAIRQNLEAIKTMSFLKVSDKKTLLSLVNFENARQIGATYAFVDKDLDINNNLSMAGTGATYLVGQLQQDRQIILNETYSVIGIPTANTDKRERVQSFEVSASLGIGINFIQTLVDTFNYDAEIGGLPIRFKINTDIKNNISNKESNNDE